MENGELRTVTFVVSDRAALIKERDCLKKDYTDLRAQFTDLEAEVTDLKVEVENRERDLSNLEDELEEAQHTIAVLRDDLRSHREYELKLKRRREAAEDEAESYLRALRAVRKQVSDVLYGEEPVVSLPDTTADSRPARSGPSMPVRELFPSPSSPPYAPNDPMFAPDNDPQYTPAVPVFPVFPGTIVPLPVQL